MHTYRLLVVHDSIYWGVKHNATQVKHNTIVRSCSLGTNEAQEYTHVRSSRESEPHTNRRKQQHSERMAHQTNAKNRGANANGHLLARLQTSRACPHRTRIEQPHSQSASCTRTHTRKTTQGSMGAHTTVDAGAHPPLSATLSRDQTRSASRGEKAGPPARARVCERARKNAATHTYLLVRRYSIHLHT